MQSDSQAEKLLVDIDQIDRRLLVELDKNCRISSTDLAVRLGKSRQTIEYRINRLLERNVLLGFHSNFNPSKLGYRLYKVYLKLRNFPEEKARLRRYLYHLGNVYWIGESSGSWDLLFGLFFKNEKELFPVTNEITSSFSRIVVAHMGHIIGSIQQYPKHYLTGESDEPIEFAGDVRDSKLDATDYSIIAELVQDARITLAELAKRLNITSVAAKRRLSRLEQRGVIVQHRVSLNLSALGLQFYKAIITLNHCSTEDHERLFEFASKTPQVQYFLRNIWTVEFEIIVSEYKEYESIINEIRKKFPRLIGSLDSLLMESDEWTPAYTNLLRDMSGK